MRLTCRSGRCAFPANMNVHVPSAQSFQAEPEHHHRILKFLLAFFIASTATLLHAQDYTSVVIFGDSLSDTGNVAHLTQEKYGVRNPRPHRRLHRWPLYRWI